MINSQLDIKNQLNTKTPFNINKRIVAGLCSSILVLTACQPKADDAEDTTSAATVAQSADTANDMAQQPDTVHDHHFQKEHTDEHPMQASNTNANEFEQAYMSSMNKMHDDMMAGMMANDADVAFAQSMLPHHKGAVAMAELQLKYGKDDAMRKLAQDIISAQQSEIQQMQDWLQSHPDSIKQEYTQAMQQAYHDSMQSMHDDMMKGIQSDDPDMAFAMGMLPHHQGAVAMAKVQLEYGKDKVLRKLAQDIIDAQQSEIELMRNWIATHS